MKKIIPVDPSKFSFTISRDLSITAVEQKPGPPVRMDGMTVGIVTMEHDAPHGGEVHPDGDEVLYVISGGVSVTSDSNPGETLELGPEDRANSRPFIPKGVYPRRSIQVAGGSWAGHGSQIARFGAEGTA
jgi:mannose-6-phosphate isomerase-like protein (cupin superfamily)